MRSRRQGTQSERYLARPGTPSPRLFPKRAQRANNRHLQGVTSKDAMPSAYSIRYRGFRLDFVYYLFCVLYCFLYSRLKYFWHDGFMKRKKIISTCNYNIIPCHRNRTKPNLSFRTSFDSSEITKLEQPQ